jgi:phage repressor protein C with HTH and peptisase S24 domain
VEFDWLGVLIGPDLRYENGTVIGDPAKRVKTDSSLKGSTKALTAAKGDAAGTAAVHAKVRAIIKHTYKVLLSRGRKGCYVWCADAGLREYLRDRLRLASRAFAEEAARHGAGVPLAAETVIQPEPGGKRHVEWLPVYDLHAAASECGPSVAADCLGWTPTPQGVKADERYFVSQVLGRSMEPLNPDGAYCVFRTDVAGTRAGRTLLVQHWAISDPETGGSYTVKEYRSLKVEDPETDDEPTWRHTAIGIAAASADVSEGPRSRPCRTADGHTSPR